MDVIKFFGAITLTVLVSGCGISVDSASPDDGIDSGSGGGSGGGSSGSSISVYTTSDYWGRRTDYVYQGSATDADGLQYSRQTKKSSTIATTENFTVTLAQPISTLCGYAGSVYMMLMAVDEARNHYALICAESEKIKFIVIDSTGNRIWQSNESSNFRPETARVKLLGGKIFFFNHGLYAYYKDYINGGDGFSSFYRYNIDPIFVKARIQPEDSLGSNYPKNPKIGLLSDGRMYAWLMEYDYNTSSGLITSKQFYLHVIHSNGNYSTKFNMDEVESWLNIETGGQYTVHGDTMITDSDGDLNIRVYDNALGQTGYLKLDGAKITELNAAVNG